MPNGGLVQNDGTLPARVVAAKNIRIELARAFPGVKFSVKSTSFSGGSDINVSWTDGPTTKQIDGIIQKYQAGSFDGSVDLYTYEHSAWTEYFGTAKYIFANRHYSDAMTKKVIDALKLEYGTFDAPSVEDYKQGKAWSTTPMSKAHGNVDQDWSWQSIISRTLSDHTAW